MFSEITLAAFRVSHTVFCMDVARSKTVAEFYFCASYAAGDFFFHIVFVQTCSVRKFVRHIFMFAFNPKFRFCHLFSPYILIGMITTSTSSVVRNMCGSVGLDDTGLTIELPNILFISRRYSGSKDMYSCSGFTSVGITFS